MKTWGVYVKMNYLAAIAAACSIAAVAPAQAAQFSRELTGLERGFSDPSFFLTPESYADVAWEIPEFTGHVTSVRLELRGTFEPNYVLGQSGLVAKPLLQNTGFSFDSPSYNGLSGGDYFGDGTFGLATTPQSHGSWAQAGDVEGGNAFLFWMVLNRERADTHVGLTGSAHFRLPLTTELLGAAALGSANITDARITVANEGYLEPLGPITRVLAGAPEPSAWVLMICGMGLAGCALRRRTVPAPRVHHPAASTGS